MTEQTVAAVNALLDAMSAADSNLAHHEVVEAFDSLDYHFCRVCGKRRPAPGSACPCPEEK